MSSEKQRFEETKPCPGSITCSSSSGTISDSSANALNEKRMQDGTSTSGNIVNKPTEYVNIVQKRQPSDKASLMSRDIKESRPPYAASTKAASSNIKTRRLSFKHGSRSYASWKTISSKQTSDKASLFNRDVMESGSYIDSSKAPSGNLKSQMASSRKISKSGASVKNKTNESSKRSFSIKAVSDKPTSREVQSTKRSRSRSNSGDDNKRVCDRPEPETYCFSSTLDEYCDECAEIRPAIPGSYEYGIPMCFADRPRWVKYFAAPDACTCHGDQFQCRLDNYMCEHPELLPVQSHKVTKFIATDYGHLFESEVAIQKRPLWGPPVTQWEIDNVKRPPRMMTSDPPYTPLPTFFKPLAPIPGSVCVEDDAKAMLGRRPPGICTMHTPDYSRRVHIPCAQPRKPQPHPEREPPSIDQKPQPRKRPEDSLLKRLMKEMQRLFDEFLLRKVPIIWIYGRPIKSIANIRRRYAIELAQKNNFSYLSLDDEIAVLAAKGSRAIQAGNLLFEGFLAIERLALPICIKLVTEKPTFALTRDETMDMLKFLMLKYHPAKGYIIDGFPLDEYDNEDFESTFYPVACGLYFLDEEWTESKAIPPLVLHPLYFRRQIRYQEKKVEEACAKLGLRTLKVIGTETLFDDENKLYALHAVVEEYLEEYGELLQGNEEYLRDDSLEYQTFGETVGYGVDLEEFVKKKRAAQKAKLAEGAEIPNS